MYSVYGDFLDFVGISNKISGFILFLILPMSIFSLWTVPQITDFLSRSTAYFSIQSSIIAIKLIISLGFLSLTLIFVLLIEAYHFKTPIIINRIRKYREKLKEIQQDLRIQIEPLSSGSKKKFLGVLKKLEREADFYHYYAANFDKTNYDLDNKESLNEAISNLIEAGIDRYIESEGMRYKYRDVRK